MQVVNTFQMSKGPPKFCIDLEADWLLILEEVGGKSPGCSKTKLFYRAENEKKTQDNYNHECKALLYTSKLWFLYGSIKWIPEGPPPG